MTRNVNIANLVEIAAAVSGATVTDLEASRNVNIVNLSAFSPPVVV